MRIVFMGTPQAAVLTLERCISDGHDIVAVYTQPDRPSGRGQKLTASPVKVAAAARELEVLQPTKLRIGESIDTFRGHKADLAVVVAYGRILPPEYLAAYPLGAVNVHFSLLPKYRGAAPVNWAIARGEKETGVTTMKMDTGLDTGDILMQSATAIGAEENAMELMSRLARSGADLLSRTLTDLRSIRPRPQDNSAATYAPILKKEDGRVDWGLNACEISDRIRGFQPFPGSFTHLAGKRVGIWKAHTLAANVESGPVGQVISVDQAGIVVRCGEGSLLQLLEMQPEGKRRMSVRDFLNGFMISPGVVFGQ